ncbi:unnamed protein product [Caenorhabditis auriculariae]|uniref:non-specific protein-tyrosine kinase n=1 Tax=Caenorhabditis auriculariae TaxID=2777116 RepID=A0A8S1HHQ0_9PELO|nr:unnamed protein product [Caenorhabditis auriculariae]
MAQEAYRTRCKAGCRRAPQASTSASLSSRKTRIPNRFSTSVDSACNAFYVISELENRSLSLGRHRDCTASRPKSGGEARFFRSRHASAERPITNIIAREMNSGNFNHSSHSLGGFRVLTSNSMISANGQKDLLSPGNDVVVTRTVSPSFYTHGMPVPDSVFRKDDVVRIVAPTSDPSWFRAKNSNHEEGLVHVDCVRSSAPSSSFDGLVRMRANATPSILDSHGMSATASHHSIGGSSTASVSSNTYTNTPQPWFHSMISRENAERFLLGKSDGTFLVRESTNYPGDYTLSMSYRGKVEHYRIYQSSGGQMTCDNEEFFSNLTQLVSHYKRDADGLCHRLVTPIICESYAFPTNGSSSGVTGVESLEDRTSVFRQAGLVIPSSDVRLGDIIGHGEFGDVRLGVFKDRKVALKVSKRHGNGMLDSLLDEAKFMVGLAHRNLVTLVGVVLDDVNIYMITEYMANGNLVDLLRSRGRHQLDKRQLMQFAIDICEGMCYLESRQIVHRDLAARNVLLDENFVAKISDFGLAKKATSTSHDSASGKFPIKWTAPEALRNSLFTTKSDVWSFGILLWEIFSFGRIPYPRIPIQDVVRHIERGYRMEAPEGCPPEVVRVMNDAWALAPNDRPPFGQMLQRLMGIKCRRSMADFKSFVDYDGSPPTVAAVAARASPLPEEKEEISLFEDEIEGTAVDNVSFYFQFEPRQKGRVVCTKVRLRFTPIVPIQREIPRRSRMIDDFYDVPICSVATIYVALVKNVSRGKRKLERMSDTLSGVDVVSLIRIVLKDFRTVTVDFEMSQNGTLLANQILFFTRPGSLEMYPQLGAGLLEKGSQLKLPFNSLESWKQELRRCGQSVETGAPWRVCSLLREGLPQITQGYPTHVVVPEFLARPDIDKLIRNWKLGRFPVWVWSKASTGNASLLISAEHENNLSTADLVFKVSESVSRCHKKDDRPFILHLDENFLPRVGKAYDYLLRLCSFDSTESFKSSESSWLSSLHKTGWLHLIRDCFSAANEAIGHIVDRDRSVILCESEGRDMSILVASLVQICCDRYYRTIRGMRSLVEKMWIAFGHPFGTRLLGRSDSNASAEPKNQISESSFHPTWLIFLDSVAQLLKLYPVQFEYSAQLLMSLWDVSLTGMAPALVCNDLQEQLADHVGGGPFPLETYFLRSYTAQFLNPLHDVIPFLDSIAQKKSMSLRPLLIEVLRPPTTLCDIRLWNECYLRWVPSANMTNTGRRDECFAVDEVVENFARKMKIKTPKRQTPSPTEYSSAYPYSEPVQRVEDFSSSDFEMVEHPRVYEEFDRSSVASISSFAFPSFGDASSSKDATYKLEYMREDSATSLTGDSRKDSSVEVKPRLQLASFSNRESTIGDIVIAQSGANKVTGENKTAVPTPRKEKPVPPPRPPGLTLNSTKSQNPSFQMESEVISDPEKKESSSMSEAEARVRQYVGKWVQVILSDGRMINGRIICTDKHPNIILSKAEERWEEGDEPRYIGQAMVARKHITKMYFLKRNESCV